MDGLTLEPLPTPTAPAAAAVATGRAGGGTLRVESLAGRTRVTRAFARQPLRILAPASPADAAVAYVTTYGGGLLAGDAIRLSVEAGQGTTALLTTQAATKVYRSPDGRAASQSLDASVADGALLVAWPDPVIAFAGARYEQRQTFQLAPGASLAVVDCQAAGRVARGERWAFGRYLSRNRIVVGGRRVVDDAVLLDEGDGPLDAPFRTGRFDALATAILVGPRLRPLIDALAAGEAAVRLHAARVPAAFLSSVGRVGDAVIVRAAAAGGARAAEAVTAHLRQVLAPLLTLIGLDPWSRKW